METLTSIMANSWLVWDLNNPPTSVWKGVT